MANGAEKVFGTHSLAEEVHSGKGLWLVGVSGYEGVVANARDDATLRAVDEHCRRTADVFASLSDLYETDAPISPHGALGQLIPAQAETGPPAPVDLADDPIHRKAILGGLTYKYHPAALSERWAQQTSAWRGRRRTRWVLRDVITEIGGEIQDLATVQSAGLRFVFEGGWD